MVVMHRSGINVELLACLVVLVLLQHRKQGFILFPKIRFSQHLGGVQPPHYFVKFYN